MAYIPGINSFTCEGAGVPQPLLCLKMPSIIDMSFQVYLQQQLKDFVSHCITTGTTPKLQLQKSTGSGLSNRVCHLQFFLIAELFQAGMNVCHTQKQ